MKKISLLLFIAAIALLQCDKKAVIYPYDPTVKGCGDFFVCKNLGNNQMLEISIDYRKTTFSKKLQVFEKIQDESFAFISIEQNDEFDKIWREECNDVAEQLLKPSVIWTLVEGKLSYKVDKVFSEYGCVGNDYRATVILENATFKNNDTGETLNLTKEEMNNVGVGWCAG